MTPLPCPFCGAEPRVTKDPNWYFVRCEECDCEGPSADRHNTDDAIERWNRRAAPTRDVLVDVLASLAAAISLLEHSPKKAAPSDKMFDQMLTDYRASLERGRKAIP